MLSLKNFTDTRARWATLLLLLSSGYYVLWEVLKSSELGSLREMLGNFPKIE